MLGDNCYSIGQYLRPVPFHFCGSQSAGPMNIGHIIAVSKVPSALVAVPAMDIVRKCVFVSLRASCTNAS